MELHPSYFGTSFVTIGPLILSGRNTKKWLMPQRPAVTAGRVHRRCHGTCAQRSSSEKQSGRSCDRPDLLETDFVSNYAVRLRSIRSVLAPNGSSSNAPAIIVVGSGTGATAGNRVIDSMFALAGMV